MLEIGHQISPIRLAITCVREELVKQQMLVLVFLVICTITSVPRIISWGLVNIADLSFSRQVVMVVEDDPNRSAYYLTQHVDRASLEQARILTTKALMLNRGDPGIRWNLARLRLAQGDALLASELLPVDNRRLLKNSLPYYETLMAHSWACDHVGVIALSESGLSSLSDQFRQMANDVIALAYLTRAKELLGTGECVDAKLDLQRALEKRPGDLYALYHLMKIETTAGNTQVASIWRDQLVHFSEAGLYFSDARLADFAAEAISQLLAEGMWKRPVALNSVATLTWREFESPGTELFIQRLSRRYPEESEWPYLLGEMFQRRGMLARAQVEYKRALAIGLSRQEGLEEQELAVPDERLIVAEQLELPPDVIAFGPNLLSNSGFEPREEESNSLPGWQPVTMAGYQPFDRGLFYVGSDTLNAFAGQQSARISGLWVGNNPELGRPNAGFWVWDETRHANQLIPVQAGAIYLLSFYYRTEWVEESSVGVWLNSGTEQTGSLRGECYFPPTRGVWRQVFLIGSVGDDNPEISAVSPLLRLWGPGQVWFDDVQLRQIIVPVLPTPTLVQDPIVVVR